MALDQIITLNDNSARLPKELRARTVEFTAEEKSKLTNGKMGAYSSLIDRNKPIEVIRGDTPDAPHGVMAAHAPAPVAATSHMNPLRRDAMDDIAQAQGVITVKDPAIVGGRTTPANATVIKYEPWQLLKAGAARTATAQPPSTPPAPTVLPPQTTWTSTVVPQPPAAPPTQVAQPTTQALTISAPTAASPLKRETVNLSSPTIGKHRLKVAQLLVSSSIVVLVYEDNDESTIYEPPALGADHILCVEHGADKYECVYHGLSVSQPVVGQPGRQLLLVVLVRV